MELWNYFKSLFKQSEESSISNPFIQEMIERTEEETITYELWKNTLSPKQLLDWIALQYKVFRTAPTTLDEKIDFLNTPSAKGFVIHFNDTFHNHQDIIHLFDYLKERTLLLEYRKYLSDRKIYTRKNWVEKLERHYLKPRIKFKDEYSERPMMYQQYGNVMIALLYRDDKIINLKYSVTTYHDRSYVKANSFEDLMLFLTE